MYEPFELSSADAAFRHADGGENLAAAPGQWFAFGPAAPDHRVTLSGLAVTVRGAAVLQHLAQFGDAPGRLDVALVARDRFGRLRDLAGTRAHVQERLNHWRRGDHNGTVPDPAVGRRPDGEELPGLRGTYLTTGQTPLPVVAWRSTELDLLGGGRLAEAFWSIDDLRAPDGTPQNSYQLALRVGQRVPSGVSWQSLDLTGVAGAYDAQSIAFDSLTPQADLVQWVVRLTYGPPGQTAPGTAAPLRTATVFRVGLVVHSPGSSWSFGSLAGLLRRADTTSRHFVRGWDASEDVALLRLPLSLRLDGRHGEHLRARFAAAAPGLSAIEIAAIGDVRVAEDG